MRSQRPLVHGQRLLGGWRRPRYENGGQEGKGVCHECEAEAMRARAEATKVKDGGHDGMRARARK